jgi:hypothetical protein
VKLSLGFSIAQFLLVLSAALATFPTSQKTAPDLTSFDRKLEHLETNGERAHPDPHPTVFTEQEVNAYLASEQVTLPDGVQWVKLEGHPQTVTGKTRVDFDRLRAGTRSSNPLLAIFSGVHDVVVETHAYGAGHEGHVHVDSVSLDGVEIPRFVLELFVEKYLQPNYPEIGLDSRFTLPNRIDAAAVGEHTLTLVQK